MKKYLLALWLTIMASPAFAGVSCTLPFNLQNGTTADATQVMANYNAIISCLGLSAAAGANSDITSLLGLTTPIPPAEGGTTVFIGGTSTGSANAQVLTVTVPSDYTATNGYTIVFTAGFTNTGTTTFNINSSGVLNVYRMTPTGPAPLTGGEIVVGQLVVAVYDGTQFELLSNPSQYGGVGPLTALASGTTTDLGTVPSHNVSISGATTITSFGQTAVLTYPSYNLYFQGALTITYNQTACSTTGGCIATPGAANITTAAGDTAVAQYLGAGSSGPGNWLISNYQKANGSGLTTPTPLCGASNLLIVNNSGTPNTEVNITASSAVMINPTGNVPIYVTSASVTINETTNGANGLDAGSLAASTWYYHYLISNGTTTAGLTSLSSTSPTMPSGYTYRCRLGAGITNGSSNLYVTQQKGNSAQYIIGTNPANMTVLTIASGASIGTYSVTNPVLHAESISAFVPPTASMINLAAGNGANTAAGILIASNSGWGGTGNGPQGTNGNIYPFWSNALIGTQAFWMQLESSNIYVATNSTGNGPEVGALGWRDQVNAN